MENDIKTKELEQYYQKIISGKEKELNNYLIHNNELTFKLENILEKNGLLEQTNLNQQNYSYKLNIESGQSE